MKKISMSALILVMSVRAWGAETKPTYPNEVAAAIVKKLPAGWRCFADHSVIVITRENKVTLLNPISLPALSREKTLKEFGFKSSYVIVLTFRPRLRDDEYKALFDQREIVLNKIRARPKDEGKESLEAMQKALIQFPLPKLFNAAFSVYVHRSDMWPLEVFPESAAKERNVVWQAVSDCFSEYVDPIEPKRTVGK